MRPLPPSNKSKRLIKVNAMSQARLIKLLLEGTYTCPELAEMSGLHYVTVLQYCRELHLVGAAHICEWEKDCRGRDNLKIYKLGVGTDKRRSRMTEQEKQARYRSKMQAAKVLRRMAGPIPETA